MMAVAAFLATASSVNATLYASEGLPHARLVGEAVSALLRPRLTAPRAPRSLIPPASSSGRQPLDLSAIASMGSACSLMIFLLVGHHPAFRLRDEKSTLTREAPILLLGMGATGGRAGLLRDRHGAQRPRTFGAIVGIAVLAVVLDLVWKRVRPEPPPAAAAVPVESGGP